MDIGTVKDRTCLSGAKSNIEPWNSPQYSLGSEFSSTHYSSPTLIFTVVSDIL